MGDRHAKNLLGQLCPTMGPWTAAALWHGAQPLAPVPATDLADELQVVCNQRLAGLMLRYVRESGAVLEPDHLDVLHRAAFAWTMRAFDAIKGSGEVMEMLAAQGGAAVVSKGPGVARLYPSPECRPFADIDVIVGASSFTGLAADLERQGWREEDRNLQPWNYFRRWCREGLNLTMDDGAGVDLHHRAPPWLWSTGLDPDAMASRAQPFVVGGVQFNCLAPADNLLVVALHLVSDRNTPGQTLIGWRDLVELARVVPVEQAVEVAVQAGLSGWLRAVLQALPEGVDCADLLAALPDDRIAHPRRLAFVLSPKSARFGVTVTQFLRLPLPNGLAFLGGMTVPSRAFLARKFPGETKLYRRWWSEGLVRSTVS